MHPFEPTVIEESSYKIHDEADVKIDRGLSPSNLSNGYLYH